MEGHPWEMQKFIDPSLLDRLRVGPLAAYLDTYLERIEHAGFLPSSVPMQMYAIARFVQLAMVETSFSASALSLISAEALADTNQTITETP